MRQAARDFLNRRIDEHVMGRSELLRDITADLHEDAPRGGTNLNRFGERRSAEGEQPAPETRRLLRLIRGQRLERANNVIRIIVNYRILETGTRTIAPRPMGRISLEELKQSIK